MGNCPFPKARTNRVLRQHNRRSAVLFEEVEPQKRILGTPLVSIKGVFPICLIPILPNMHAMNGHREGLLLPLLETGYNPSEFKKKIQMLTGYMLVFAKRLMAIEGAVCTF